VPDKTPKRQAEDLRDLVVAYAKQETLEPLKESSRLLRYGVGGALVIGIGVLFLAIGTLRMLQTETGDALDGNWTIVIYLIVIVLLAIGAAASAAAAQKSSKSSPAKGSTAKGPR
jgi:hypothetical protein